MNPDLSYTSQSEQPVSSPAPKSLFSRISGVWFSPGEAFAEIGRAPRILVPIIILMVMGSVTSYLTIDRVGVRNMFEKQFEQAVANGQMSQEDANKQLETLTNGPMATITKASFPIIGLFIYPVIALIFVGVAKLITLMTGGENKFKQLFSVTVYAQLAVAVITVTLTLIVLYLKSPEDIDINNPIGSNLGTILSLAIGPDGLPKFVMGLAKAIDIFLIWPIVLVAIGYAAVSRKVKASTMGVGLGIVYMVLAVIGAALSAVRG